MGFKIDVEKYRLRHSSFQQHIKDLVAESMSDVLKSGKVNKIQENFLLDLELIVRTTGMGEVSNSDIKISGEQQEPPEVINERQFLGMYDFIDSQKSDESRRKDFWILIHQVNHEIIRETGNAKMDLNIIVPLHFVPILEMSMSFISAEDEKMGGIEEFRGEKISYAGRLNDSNFTIYSFNNPDNIYISLKDGRFAMIRIK